MRRYLVVLLVATGSRSAAAQTCTGNLPFSFGRFHLAANLAVDKLAQQYTGEFRFGTRGVFGAVEVGLKTWDVSSLHDESNTIGLVAGVELPLPVSKLSVCPLLSWTSLSGPQNYVEKAYAAGLTMGYPVLSNSAWGVTPVVALSVGTRNPWLKGRDPSFPLPPYWRRFCCGRETVSTMSLAVGLGFTQQVTVIPSVGFPLGAHGETTYALRAALRLGKGP